MKVALCSPDYGGLCSTVNKFTNGSDRVWLAMNGHEEFVFGTDAVDISTVRNKAMHHAIDAGCNRLLMIDSDVAVEGGNSSLASLMPLMDEKDCALAGIPVMLRRAEQMPDGRWKNTVNCSPIFAGEVYQGRVATGILLINLDQVKELPEPWFYDVRNENNTERTVTQDMYFCDKVRDAGLKVYVDFRIPSVHRARPEYSTADLIRSKFVTTTQDVR